jgi:hypothetical protein
VHGDVGFRLLMLSDVVCVCVCVWLVADFRVFTAAVDMEQVVVKVKVAFRMTSEGGGGCVM